MDILSFFVPLMTIATGDWQYQLSRLLRLHFLYNYYKYFSGGFKVKPKSLFFFQYSCVWSQYWNCALSRRIAFWWVVAFYRDNRCIAPSKSHLNFAIGVLNVRRAAFSRCIEHSISESIFHRWCNVSTQSLIKSHLIVATIRIVVLSESALNQHLCALTSLLV